MLTHRFAVPTLPMRIVVLGAAGFVGAATAARLRALRCEVLALGRSDLDLQHPSAGSRLAHLLQPDDALVFVAAQAPVKTIAMFEANIVMLRAVAEVLSQTPVAHLLYISSDAVYADSTQPLRESSCAEPASLHGAMHLAREVALKTTFAGPIAILRPTLIYGAGDPHNGYGPNRFRRLAAEGKEIVLFGEGEERRDHVLIDDVAELACRIVLHRSEGVLNAATGTVISFREIAEKVVALAGAPVAIKGSPRTGPIPHNGYRAFDPATTLEAFPDFTYTPIDAGLMQAQAETQQ